MGGLGYLGARLGLSRPYSLSCFTSHPLPHSEPRVPVHVPAGSATVQERSFKGQAGFWGDIDGAYQTAWDGEDREDGADGPAVKPWH